MEPINPVDAARIARDVERRAEARRVLDERMPIFSWNDGLAIAVAVGVGGYCGPTLGDAYPWLPDAVAGIGFYLGLSAYGECLRLRRRLNAAIALLDKN